MPLTLQQIRKNCAQARERMAQARSEHWAFGAFNLDDEATLKAVAQAAASKKAPVLVEVSQGEVDDIGLDNVRDLVDNFKAQYGVEMYVNLTTARASRPPNLVLRLGSNSSILMSVRLTMMPLTRTSLRQPRRSRPMPS